MSQGYACHLLGVTLLASAVWLTVLAGSPGVSAAPGDLLGTIDLSGNGNESVGGTFDGIHHIAPFSGSGWASNILNVYQPPGGGGGSANLVASKTLVDSGDQPVKVGAVTWDPNRQKVWGSYNHVIWLIEMDDPTVSGDALATLQFNSSVGGNIVVDGLAYDSADDTLYYSPDQDCCVYHFSLGADFNPANPPLGTLMNTVRPKNSVGAEDGNISGVAIGSGGSLYVGRPSGNEIRHVDKVTGGFIAQFAALSASAWVEDLTCDPVTYAPKEAILAKYAFNSLYEAFEVAEGTCPLAVDQSVATVPGLSGPGLIAFGSLLAGLVIWRTRRKGIRHRLTANRRD